MKKILTSILIIGLIAGSCTKVTEKAYSSYAAGDFYKTPAGPDIALAAIYPQMQNYAGGDNGWYDLNSMSTDEQVIPHRNTGDWQLDFAQLYQRQWLPTLGIINTAYSFCYNGIYAANQAISQLTAANAVPAKVAEAKVLRAFFYYLLIDDFGSVPFYTDNNVTVDKIPQASRKVIFDFIISELTANVDLLSETKGGAYYGRWNKWAGYTLLAKVYLNAEVLTGTAKWTECLAACNKVASGGFTLHPATTNASSLLGNTYYDLFGDVLPSDETILAIFEQQNTLGHNIYSLRSLNGPNALAVFGYSGWNGTIVPKNFYQKYADTDIRKKQFLVGPQPGGVDYSLDVTSLDNPGAGKNEGVRNVKFYPVLPMNGSGESNDFPVYRFADILLMQAECNVRLGSASVAKPFIDRVRVRAGLSPLAADPTLDNIYDERGFELNWEGHRREDMIRFNKFLLAHDFAPAADSHLLLFPIPTSKINANPLIKQNPGY